MVEKSSTPQFTGSIADAGRELGFFRTTTPNPQTQVDAFERDFDATINEVLGLPHSYDSDPGSEPATNRKGVGRLRTAIGAAATAAVLAYPTQTAEVVEIVKDKAVETVRQGADNIHDGFYGPDS